MNPTRIRLLSNKHQQQSPQFRSKVNRSLQQEYAQQFPGPGQYQISLPLVKPRIQAIQKNGFSIIIKINNRLSPVFQSIEPRFKQSINHVNNNQNNNNNQELTLSSDINSTIHEANNRIFKRKKTILSYNSKLKRQRQSIPSIRSIVLQQGQQCQSQEIINKVQNRGCSWSKYREQRKVWSQVNPVPGPGSYNFSQFATNTKKYFVDNNSWQFKSRTNRQNLISKLNRYKSKSVVKETVILQKFQNKESIHTLPKN